jgi:hypothetical protein
MISISNYYKKIIFRVLAGFLACTVIVVGLQTYLFFAINSDMLKTAIADYFSTNLGKAVKYDSAKVWFFDGITLKNFYLSRNDDFNDNLPLLRCQNLYIGISLYDLIRKNITIKKISVDNAEINISKQYADTHKVFWKSLLLPGKKNDSIQGFAQGGLSISISNSRIMYRETFENESTQISVSGFESEIIIGKNGKIGYSASGSIDPRQGSKGNSRFSVNGFYFETSSDSLGKTDFSVKNLDLSHLNPYVSLFIENKVSIGGLGKIDIHSYCLNDSCSFSGKISAEDCTARMNQGVQDDSLIMKSSFTTSFSADIIDGKKYHIRDMNIYDGNIDLSLSGIYQKSSLDETLSLSYNLDPCDVDKLASSYRFSKNISLNGILSSTGVIFSDFSHSITDYLNTNLKVKNFELKGSSDLSWLGKIKGDINTSMFTDAAGLKVSGFIYESPFSITLESFIKKYSPLTSDSVGKIESDGIRGEFLKNLMTVGMNSFIYSVYSDRKKGYEDIKFLDTIPGGFVNLNDVNVEIVFPRLLLGKAALTKISANAVLKKGVFRGDLLSAEGFGAKYSTSAEGFLNSDFPKIALKCSVDNFDFGIFSQEGGFPGINSGIMSASLQYTMNGNRLSHFVDNGQVESSVSVLNLNIDRSGYISNFEIYLKSRGLDVSLLPMSVQSGKVEYRQTGENGAFSIMNFASDKFRAEGYGRYTYFGGINVMGTLSIPAKDIKTPSMSVNCKITGALGAPVLKIDVKGKPSDGFVLY